MMSVPKPEFTKDFKSFLIGNNILTVAAAVTIAFSTGTMIRSLTADIVLPSVYRLFAKNIKTLSGAFAPINKLNLDNFVKEVISWIMVIVLTFLLIEYVIRRWMLKTPSTISTPLGGGPPPPAAVAPAVQKPTKDEHSSSAGSVVTENFMWRSS